MGKKILWEVFQFINVTWWVFVIVGIGFYFVFKI